MTFSVSDQCRSCIAILHEVISALAQPDRNSNNVRNLRMREELDRFSLFVGNIGALHRPESPMSIESRLQGANDVLTHILGLLDDLKEVIRDLLDIVLGEREEMVSVADETEDECGGISEVNELQEEISETVTRLFRVSTLIRRAAPTDIFAKALSRNRYHFNDQFDISHVGEKYPKLVAKDSAWLCQRLRRAITQRRRYLSYIQDHREKLADPLSHHEKSGGSAYKPQIPNIKQSLGPKPTLNRESLPSFFTKATTIAAEKLAPQLNVADESDPDDARSYTTISRSIDSDHESSTNVRIPKLDSLRTDRGKEFECPFCFRIKKFKSERMWKKHVFSDLRPYVCTFPDCDAPYFGDINEWFQHEMTFHRVDYKCFLCARFFNQEEKYILHLKREHEETLDDGGEQTARDLSRKSLAQIPATDCPCCSDWSVRLKEQVIQTSGSVPTGILAVTLTVFKRHLAGHLEQLALFAIPISASTDANNDSNAAVEEAKSKRTDASRFSALIFSSDRGGVERSTLEIQVDESRGLLHTDIQPPERETSASIEYQPSVSSHIPVEETWEKTEQSNRLAALTTLAVALSRSGTWKDAHALYAHVVETSKKKFGLEHHNSVSSKLKQKSVYEDFIDFVADEEDCLRTSGVDKGLPSTDFWVIVFNLQNVATELHKQRRYTEEEVVYRQALMAYENTLGDEHVQTISTIAELAYVTQELEKWEEAENWYKRYLELQRKKYGYWHQSTLPVARQLVLMFAKLGKPTEAVYFYKDALKGYQSTSENDTRSLLSFGSDLGSLLVSMEKYEEAELLCRELLSVYQEKDWHQTEDAFSVRKTLAEILNFQKKYDEAKDQYRDLSQLQSKQLLEDCDKIQKLIVQGMYDQANYVCIQALGACRKNFGIDSPQSVPLLRELSAALLYQQRLVEAENILRRALKIHEVPFEDSDITILDVMRDLGKVIEMRGRLDEAHVMRMRMADAVVDMGTQAAQAVQAVLGTKEQATARQLQAARAAVREREIAQAAAQELQVAQETIEMQNEQDTNSGDTSEDWDWDSDSDDIIF